MLCLPLVQRQFEEHVRRLLGLTRIPVAGGQEGGAGERREGGPQPRKEKEGAGEGGREVSSGSKADDLGSPEEEGGDEGPLAAALRAKRRDLKPTEVLIHTHTHAHTLIYSCSLSLRRWSAIFRWWAQAGQAEGGSTQPLRVRQRRESSLTVNRS